MSKYPQAQASAAIPTILPPQQSESKRDRKRRETVNKIELLHNGSWNNRDEKFSQQYKEYHNENKAVNTQPPTSSKYLLRLYPKTIERDAFLTATETHHQYKVNQAKKMYESERDHIEGMYWEARDQVRQRLLASIEERRRKLREEKEGGDVVTESLLETQTRRPPRRSPFRSRIEPKSTSRSATPALLRSNGDSGHSSPADGNKGDILLHAMLAPALAQISTDDILTPQSTSLVVAAPPNGYTALQNTKRGPRGKATNDDKDVGAAPGTSAALAIASGQTSAPTNNSGKRGAGAQSGWVLGKALNDMRKMEEATILERDSDWARIQGSTQGRGRRARGD
ncbi:hypothetical protein VHUM_01082 [Vanrija humicola]|uniref:Uncharacterized protein n=1 Tax=Vanrija humicola TaxID=5417 RepID=A0A7D8ZGW6_VANHU|nr:hypothetical protein VHUM_01082 [Vanrija humicola]